MGLQLDTTKGEQVYRGLVITSPKEGVWRWRNPLTLFKSAEMKSVESVKEDIDREHSTQVTGEVSLPFILDQHKAEMEKIVG